MRYFTEILDTNHDGQIDPDELVQLRMDGRARDPGQLDGEARPRSRRGSAEADAEARADGTP